MTSNQHSSHPKDEQQKNDCNIEKKLFRFIFFLFYSIIKIHYSSRQETLEKSIMII